LDLVFVSAGGGRFPQRLKAGVQINSFIAAVNRCATQRHSKAAICFGFWLSPQQAWFQAGQPE
jgi:hypothetical protein